jgi:hypothetical protein
METRCVPTSACIKERSYFLEGINNKAREHFTSLCLPDGTWAITAALADIHSLALSPQDFQILQEHGGAMVWSPLSNLLLYGKTANIEAARKQGVRISIGADWSPSGSKNLLGELNVARLYSAANNNLLSQVLVPLDLDPLCVADDTTFFDHLQKQVNLPGYMKQSLPTLY